MNFRQLWNRLRIASRLSRTGDQRSAQEQNQKHGISTFSPSYADIAVVRAMLKALGLPTELVLLVLDFALYEPVLTFTSQQSHEAVAGRLDAVLCLDIPILAEETCHQLCAPPTTAKVKEVHFQISSHDQGWTSVTTPGSYETTSWMEVSILRPIVDPLPPPQALVFRDLNCPRDLQERLGQQGFKLVSRPERADFGPQGGEGHVAWWLQGNQVAIHNADPYTITWGRGSWEAAEDNEGAGHGDGLVEMLQEGDRLLVWARAKVRFLA